MTSHRIPNDAILNGIFYWPVDSSQWYLSFTYSVFGYNFFSFFSIISMDSETEHAFLSSFLQTSDFCNSIILDTIVYYHFWVNMNYFQLNVFLFAYCLFACFLVSVERSNEKYSLLFTFSPKKMSAQHFRIEFNVYHHYVKNLLRSEA